MQKIKSMIFTAGLMLFILSAAMIYLSIKNMGTMPSADSYEDKGIFTFIPYQVLPVQVENTGASGRSRRMNPTRTVYMVYYRDNSGAGYQWAEQAATREQGQEIVDARIAVERRILSIPENGSYITVKPEQNAKSYTTSLQKRYRIALGASGAYILLYVSAWCIICGMKKSDHGI